ncbi:MAG: DUF5667 domain-containing protein [Chloroflexota bacterium]
MTDATMEQILIEALDLLEAGHSVDSIVRRFPANGEELRRYLMTAELLASAALQPEVVARQHSREVFLEAGAASHYESKRHGVGTSIWRWAIRPLLVVVALALMSVVILSSASGRAVPGDNLYEPKLWVEQARLLLTGNPERQAQLREEQRQRRVEETKTLLADDRNATVTFTGRISSMTGDDWIVDGIVVQVTTQTDVDGRGEAGRLIEVEGRTASGSVWADRIVVLDGMPELATPEPITP